jgi:hypothetical protein
MTMTQPTKYELGRALAAEEEAKLDHYGEPEAENAVLRIDAISADIKAAGGWDSEVERGYFDARRDYAKERLG